MRRIIYDGDSFYELDEECIKRRKEKEKKKETGPARENKSRRRKGK